MLAVVKSVFCPATNGADAKESSASDSCCLPVLRLLRQRTSRRRTLISQHDASNDLVRRAIKRIPGQTQLFGKRQDLWLPGIYPSYYVDAKGVHVTDVDGNQYCDFGMHGIGSCVLGYADPDVNKAVVDAVTRGSLTSVNCPEEVELAELLCEIHPWAREDGMVRYARTGGETMTIAVRIARAYRNREVVIISGYHGHNDWYLAANHYKADALGKEGIHLSGLDAKGVPKGLAGTTVPCKYNDAEALQRLVRQNSRNLACIVVETQRSVYPNAEFLAGLKAAQDSTGCVLICDEITCGFREVVGGLHLLPNWVEAGVTPDIAVYAKAMSNGVPMGAVVGRGAVMQAAQETFLSSLFWTERIGFAAAIATIRKQQRLNVGEKLNAVGRKTRAMWEQTAKETGLEVRVWGMDCIPHLTFLADEGGSRSDGLEQNWTAGAVDQLFTQLMLERGFLTKASAGLYCTLAHYEDTAAFEAYAAACKECFAILVQAIKTGTVQSSLKGPIRSKGFTRLAE
mmetsp:Transcript_69651/g.167162  ORF Transcript_69651/g.167162 Transcript_69651/m.167162 type:complete len:513 (-) Transcript_69651:125-1663(-)|eukprot:CAMPEP_0178406286 /NCGR_PEP_ID=MMETSP0689_2-20121128/18834_1 /TAXON_ID=160604 /ORGANISM="Amphidinium massartii, Strain CS-259" /LENGTH=512 /DNA_ID=CAMNT_0020027323 /DNA_START=106 /DNA_END=1644 /DNA_ORIENTATION=-